MSVLVKNSMTFWLENSNLVKFVQKNLTFIKFPHLQKSLSKAQLVKMDLEVIVKGVERTSSSTPEIELLGVFEFHGFMLETN